MPHELMINTNGVAALAYNRKNGLPWHKLGVPVDGVMTWLEAMTKAGLNWSVSKRQLYTDNNGIHSPVKAWGIFRDDNGAFLGAVGEQYKIIQNAQAFEIVDSLLENHDAHYDTAGALFNGERIFVSATLPFSIAPDRAKNDITNCYLMFETSHDGSLSATTKLTTVRVVCNNTLSMALNQKGFGTLKIRHSQSGIDDKLDKTKRLFSGVQQTVSSLKEKFDILSNRKIGKNESNAIMEGLFGANWKESTTKRNQVERIATLFESNDRNTFTEVKGSAYAMVQAITNWTDHERAIRKTDRVNNLSEDQIRTQNAIFNGGDQFKSEALEIVLRETKNSTSMPVVQYFQSAGIPENKVESILNMVAV